MIVPVIVSGGVGSRLWPASRQSHPKPFLPVENGRSLLQNTFARAAALDDVEDIVTITALESSFKTIAEYDVQKQDSITKHLLLEPFGRDTAAAAAAATHYAAKQFGPETVLLFLAADHMIADETAFAEAVNRAAGIAKTGQIVTFGIRPSAPETGYGYIEADGERVIRFVERPRSTISRTAAISGIRACSASGRIRCWRLWPPTALTYYKPVPRPLTMAKEKKPMQAFWRPHWMLTRSPALQKSRSIMR